jgi:hypothetical protein
LLTFLSKQNFSFIHALQILNPVPSSSPYRLPSALSSQIIPSRLAKTKAPFPVAPPTNLDQLYQIALKTMDPAEVKKERNRKKKERKERSKARREAGETAEDGEGESEADGEGAAAEGQEVASTTTTAPTGPIYGLPSDLPVDNWIVFEAHYHRLHHAATHQREDAWQRSVKQLGEKDENHRWGDIVLHDSSVSRGKRNNQICGFARNEKEGTWDFHCVV